MSIQRTTESIAQLAASQHGNVTTSQLRAAGLTKRQIEQRARTHVLIPRHRSVYAVGHVPRSRPSRWHAGVLALGEDAGLSHRAAGALWNMLRFAVPTEVTVPTRAGRARRDGILVHRAPLPPEHRTTRDGIPVTTPMRTLLDLASVVRLPVLRGAFEEAQVQLGLPPESLAAEVLSRRRYRGNARLRTMLAGAVDPAGVRSILELRFVRLCAAHGIARPLINERLGTWRPDFLWPDSGVAVETDGARFHQTAAKRARDERKDEELASLGLVVLRLTWADVTESPGRTADRVRALLSPGDATRGGKGTA